MEDRGASAGFLLCKVGVAFAAVAFIGCALSLGNSSARLAEKQDLQAAADAIVQVIEKIESFPEESELLRTLSLTAQDFEITITGEVEGGWQFLNVSVEAETSAECSLILSTIVNGGDFSVRMRNPRQLTVRREGVILVELS